ncbi:MAG: SRPBCC family protein [Anaerolineales bacterium]
MKIEYSIDIHSQPKMVFARIGDPEKAKAWMKNVSNSEIIRETPERVGTTFRERVEEGGNGLDMLGEITGFVPDRSISFHLTSKIHELDVDYAVVDHAGGARLMVNSTIRWKFPMNVMELFIGKKIRSNILEEFRGECAELKRLCETENA